MADRPGGERRLRTILVTSSLAGALLSLPLEAQVVNIQVPAEGQVQELVLSDGSVFFGRVLDASDPATFRLVAGIEIQVPHADVRSLSIARARVRQGAFWRADPNRTRLFFGPTARTLPAGGGYFSVFELVMPFLSFGVTDRLILSGGTPLFFGGDEGERIFWFAPKLRLASNARTDLAVGVLAFSTIGGDGSAGILYGVVTSGGPDSAISLGLGYGWVDGDLADNPAIMLGGETRVGRRTKFITENYLLPSGDVLLSFGPRFFGERLSADLGLLLPFVDGSLDVALPLVNFVWNW